MVSSYIFGMISPGAPNGLRPSIPGHTSGRTPIIVTCLNTSFSFLPMPVIDPPVPTPPIK